MLRDDSVKDDSGACAVSTEQGSFASLMTVPKVFFGMFLQDDQIATDKQRIRAHVSKIGGPSQIAQISKVRMSRRMGSFPTTQVTVIMVKH